MRQLGELEAVVMERLWTWNRPVSVREVLEDLHQDRPLAYTTVMTVLDSLRRKGFLTREKHGRAFHYRPSLTREQHSAALMEEVLASSSDRGATLLRFVERMPNEEIAQLRGALDSIDNQPEAWRE